MNRNIITKSRSLMRRKTRENGAPAWGLTELAVGMGKKLARQCHADEKLVIASLYLAHIVFHTDRKSHRMKDHPKLSAKLARGYLKKWGVLKTEQDVIINAIAIHHSVLSPKSKVAEVMRNAEGYKFLTIEGCLIFLHDLGTRGMSWEKSVEYFLEKMNQKYALLTLPACKREMRKNISLLTQMLDRAT